MLKFSAIEFTMKLFETSSALTTLHLGYVRDDAEVNAFIFDKSLIKVE